MRTLTVLAISHGLRILSPELLTWKASPEGEGYPAPTRKWNYMPTLF